MIMKNLQRIFKRLKNKLGFTLTEMICAFALVGIIAGISVPIIGASKKSKAQKEYKQACEYILTEVGAVCDAINAGSRTLSGTVVAAPSGSMDNRENVQNYVNRINAMSYKFNIEIHANESTCLKHQPGLGKSIVEVVIANIEKAPPIKIGDTSNDATNTAGKIKVTDPRSVVAIYYYDKSSGYVYKYDAVNEKGELMNYEL